MPCVAGRAWSPLTIERGHVAGVDDVVAPVRLVGVEDGLEAGAVVAVLLAGAEVAGDLDDVATVGRDVGDGARHGDEDRIVDAEQGREAARRQRPHRRRRGGPCGPARCVGRGADAGRGVAGQQPGGPARVVDGDDDGAAGERPAVGQAHAVDPVVVLDGRRRACRCRSIAAVRAARRRRAPSTRLDQPWCRYSTPCSAARSWAVAAPASSSVVSALYVVVRISDASRRPAASSSVTVVDPLGRRPPGPLGRGARSPSPAIALATRQAVADGAAQVAGERDGGPADQHRRPVEPGHPAPDGDAEAAQDVEPAAGAVQGVRAEVEVEAVAVAAAGPPADVLGALDDRDGVAVPGERGGGGQPGEPAADDDGSWLVHATQTIDRPLL